MNWACPPARSRGMTAEPSRAGRDLRAEIASNEVETQIQPRRGARRSQNPTVVHVQHTRVYVNFPIAASPLIAEAGGNRLTLHFLRSKATEGREYMATNERSVELAGVNLAGQYHVCAFFNIMDEEHRVLRSSYKGGFDRG